MWLFLHISGKVLLLLRQDLKSVLCVDAQLVESILQPERLKACEKSLEPEAIRRLWPREVAEKSFIDYLWSQYDYTQLGAIEVRRNPLTALCDAPSSELLWLQSSQSCYACLELLYSRSRT